MLPVLHLVFIGKILVSCLEVIEMVLKVEFFIHVEPCV